jgi:hypothetical protein
METIVAIDVFSHLGFTLSASAEPGKIVRGFPIASPRRICYPRSNE